MSFLNKLKMWQKLGSLSVFIIVIVLFMVIKNGKKPKIQTVDFNNTVKTDSNSTLSPLPTLKVAIAAMISPKFTQNYYSELISIVAHKVGRKEEIIQKKTYAQVNELLEKKEIDLAFVCSGPYVDGKKKFGMQMLVVPVVHGKKIYYSYIIANKDSSISSFDDMRGKKFAFTDRNSNTGCLVPRYMLAMKSETPESFFSEVIYTNSHDNSIKAVAQGFCDGASVDHLIWEFINNTEPEYTNQTKIVQKSDPYGIPPIVVNSDMDESLKANLKKVFLSLDKDKNIKKILDKLQIDRFEEGDDSMYNTIREMKKWIKRTKRHGNEAKK